jgi:hypothetical protein
VVIWLFGICVSFKGHGEQAVNRCLGRDIDNIGTAMAAAMNGSEILSSGARSLRHIPVVAVVVTATTSTTTGAMLSKKAALLPHSAGQSRVPTTPLQTRPQKSQQKQSPVCPRRRHPPALQT